MPSANELGVGRPLMTGRLTTRKARRGEERRMHFAPVCAGFLAVRRLLHCSASVVENVTSRIDRPLLLIKYLPGRTKRFNGPVNGRTPHQVLSPPSLTKLGVQFML